MSVKKRPSEPEVAAVETEVSGAAQSAAERQSAEAQLTALIDKYAPAHAELTQAMRSWLQKRLPTAYELAYEYRDWFVISYSPSERGYEGVLAIRGSKESVKLYFHGGKDLPDPEKLLKGTSQTRFMHIENVSTLDSPAIARLIDEALAYNSVPFARAGRGPLFIRSASSRKRTRSLPA
ncbi:MAG TPA: DUF1801 domain-containing protein [Chthonomonadales bacterium]|nr:DUF1801 domain-containing protein [Chthonomonadales bacterium]